jgi:hypothetical protein
LVEEVIALPLHDYLPAVGWQEKASRVLEDMLQAVLSKLLDEFLAACIKEPGNTRIHQPAPQDDERRLGF